MIEPKATSRPAKFGNRGAWQAEADHMRVHPGGTFVIERRPHPDKAMYALAAHVRRGGYVGFRPAGAFDAWVEREGANLEVIATFTGGTHAPEVAGTVAPAAAPGPAGTVADDVAPASPEPETVTAVTEELRSLAKAELIEAAESLGWGPDTYDEERWTGVTKPELLRDLIGTAEGTIGDDADRAKLAGYFGVMDDANEDAVAPAAPEAAQDSGDEADPSPVRPKRTAEVRSENPAPGAGQETVAAPQVPSVEEILPAIKEAASSATKTYLSVGDLAKLTGHAADDINRALAAVGVVSRRKDGKHQTAGLTRVPTRFADFRVLEVAGDYRNEYTARLPWEFLPDDDTYYSAWMRMACRHLVPDADDDNDGFESCDCRLVLFYQQDGVSDVTMLAEYNQSWTTLPVALTPFGQ